MVVELQRKNFTLNTFSTFYQFNLNPEDTQTKREYIR